MPPHVFVNRLLDAERSGREERRISILWMVAVLVPQAWAPWRSLWA
jgi:hypothetical protein